MKRGAAPGTHVRVPRWLLAAAVSALCSGSVRAEGLLEALAHRAACVNGVRLAAEWRAYRTSARDPLDRSAWKPSPIDPSADVDYLLRGSSYWMHDRKIGGPPEGTQYSWHAGELTAYTPFFGEPANYVITPTRHSATLRGRILLTPFILECFDYKESLPELLARSPTPRITTTPNGHVLVEFERPDAPDSGVVFRARFDPANRWALLFLEQYTGPARGRKPMSYALHALDWQDVGETRVVTEAVIVNSNPNVLPGEVVVQHYRATSVAEVKPVTDAQFAIARPTSNVTIADYVRKTMTQLDEDGQVSMSQPITEEDLETQRRAWQAWSAQMSAIHEAKRERPIILGSVVAGSAVVVAALAFVLYRRAAMNRRARFAP